MLRYAVFTTETYYFLFLIKLVIKVNRRAGQPARTITLPLLIIFNNINNTNSL